MDEGTRRTYLKRISYLENELKEVEHKNELLDQLVDDLMDKNKIVIKFILDRMIELSNCKDKNINTRMVFNMFKALHNIIDEDDDYDE